MTTQKERRSGKERRMEPPNCSVPCPPLDKKLNDIWSCVKSKTPQKLFYWVVGGLIFFTVVIIGGAQWKIVEKVGIISTDVKVMAVTVDATKINLDRHMGKSERIFEDVEKRLDNVEHKTYRLENGKTYKQQP